VSTIGKVLRGVIEVGAGTPPMLTEHGPFMYTDAPNVWFPYPPLCYWPGDSITIDNDTEAARLVALGILAV
jgi:hypothetical protein